MPNHRHFMANDAFFQFKIEGEADFTLIPQSVIDGSDTIQFSSSWSKENIPGSTEPMVAFNFVDAPTIPINLKFHEDMWREVGWDVKGYLNAIHKFASLIYPSSKSSTIVPPYCIIKYNGYVYRGFFSNIRITESGVTRDGHKTTCEISSSFTIIKRTSPVRLNIEGIGYRTYFGEEKGEKL